MDDATSSQPSTALAEVPLLAELRSAAPDLGRSTEPEPESRGRPRRLDPSAGGDPYGVYAARELPGTAAGSFGVTVDWAQVVELRRQASAAITEESQLSQRQSGLTLTRDDRLLMGRAIIKRVVADHVRTLHREGAELWSTAQEHAYVQAVEDAVFGYGRLQPLLQLADVENIEIHGGTPSSCSTATGGVRNRHRSPTATRSSSTPSGSSARTASPAGPSMTPTPP